MIARIHGILESLEEASALIGGDGGLTYEVLLPGYTVARLGDRIGQMVTLHTLHFFESLNQGASLIPRLAGFLSVEERRFFELFTTCKGIGNRKALRAMALDVPTIAMAIADRDVPILQSLPEIGRRTAETIIATLHGKVEAFVHVRAASAAGAGDGSTIASASGLDGIGRDALELLVQLGESRTQAIQWIDQVLRSDHQPVDLQELITLAYHYKGGG